MSTSISTVAPTFTFIIRNPIFLTINFNIAGVLLTNSVEKAVLLDLNALFIYGLIRNNVIGDSKASRHSFNNLKWFQIIYLFDKLYKASNANNIVIYNIRGVVNLSFRTSGGSSVNFRLQAIYVPSAPINLISIGQLKKDGVGYDIYRRYFVYKELR